MGQFRFWWRWVRHLPTPVMLRVGWWHSMRLLLSSWSQFLINSPYCESACNCFSNYQCHWWFAICLCLDVCQSIMSFQTSKFVGRSLVPSLRQVSSTSWCFWNMKHMKAKTRSYIGSMVQERERFGTFAFILIGFMIKKKASLTNHPQASI